MKPINVFAGTLGLNTVLDPQRLSQGTVDRPGIIELAQAVNVSVDDRGLVTMRNGYSLVSEGEFHSLFCDGGDCFVVKERVGDAAIMRVNDDLSVSGIRSGLSKGLRMAWAQVNTDTFYSNGVQNGYIRDSVSNGWPVNEYSGPDVDMQFMSSIPKATHMAFRRGGQCIIAIGQLVLINHEPFKFGLFSPKNGAIQFESDITMLCATSSGFYASDAGTTWFFRKQQGAWYAFSQEIADNYPVIEWSLAHNKVSLRDIGFDSPGYGFVWATKRGICIGTEDGSVFNITKDNVVYPRSGYSTGASLIKNDSFIINTLQ